MSKTTELWQRCGARLRRLRLPHPTRRAPIVWSSRLTERNTRAATVIEWGVDAADKIEELVDRCARYAEEIAVLQEKKWVDAGARQPEYGVPVLAVANGKAGNITLCDAVVFATFYDGWELDDYPQAEDVAVKWWMPIVESPEGVSGGMEHE